MVYDIVIKVMQEERQYLREQLEDLDELEKEEKSTSISTMSYLAYKKSLPKHDEQPTHNSTEMSISKGIDEQFPSAWLPLMMTDM